jgi:hypothetical protein
LLQNFVLINIKILLRNAWYPSGQDTCDFRTLADSLHEFSRILRKEIHRHPSEIFQDSDHPARRSDPRDRRWQEGERNPIRNLRERFVCAPDNCVYLFLRGLALVPRLQTHKEKAVIGSVDLAQEAEPGNGCDVFHSRRSSEDVLDLFASSRGPLQ